MNWDWRAPAVFFLQPFRNRTFADREGSEVSKHWPKLEALIPASDKHPLASSFLYPLPETFRFMKGRCSLYASSTLAPQKEKRASEVGNNFRRVCHRLDICNNSSYQTDGRRWTISLCHTHTHTHSPAEPVDQYRPYVISKDVHARTHGQLLHTTHVASAAGKVTSTPLRGIHAWMTHTIPAMTGHRQQQQMPLSISVSTDFSVLYLCSRSTQDQVPEHWPSGIAGK